MTVKNPYLLLVQIFGKLPHIQTAHRIGTPSREPIHGALHSRNLIMGFFSDLKEDLSQAVNELMPEDEQTGTDEMPAEEAAEGLFRFPFFSLLLCSLPLHFLPGCSLPLPQRHSPATGRNKQRSSG